MKDLFKHLLLLIVFLYVLSTLFIPIIEIDEKENSYIDVEIRGDVLKPKVVKLPLGSTFEVLLDNIELTNTSDISNYSMNMVLYNNQIINIRSISKSSSRLSINSATKEELMKINGIGEKTAEKIIKYRENNGGFKSIDELMNVSGIGISKYEKFKDYITL